MSVYLEALTIACSLVGVWYTVSSLVAIGKKRLDPSIITYFSPFYLCNYKFSRVVLAGMASTILLAPTHAFMPLLCAAIVLVFVVVQIALLVIFGRSGTQPLAYYASIAIGAIIAASVFTLALTPMLLVLILLVQELLLQRWLKDKNQIYNNWVAKKVVAIDCRFEEIAKSYTDREWLFILHFAVTESIARPRASRLIETMYYHLKHPAKISSGIMQVQANRLLTDYESMQRGSRIVQTALKSMPASLETPQAQLKWLARSYNGSTNEQANDEYTSYLISTYPGLLLARKR